jgi:hypothetical protein
MRYFLDTEFNGFGGELISLALVSDDGKRSLYVATECKNPQPWVAENVLPIIDAGTDPIMIQPEEFGRAIAIFLSGDNFPVIISDWPDDIRYFCQALITGPGQMVAIPGVAFQMLRVDAYPTTLEGAIQHNALWDARALRQALRSGQPANPT